MRLSNDTAERLPNDERTSPRCKPRLNERGPSKVAGRPWTERTRETDRKEMMMNNPNKSKTTPEFLKGSTVDEKGLPLRLKIQGERRLDRPYQSANRFKLVWTLRDGV